jgi:hypothetical protein
VATGTLVACPGKLRRGVTLKGMPTQTSPISNSCQHTYAFSEKGGCLICVTPHQACSLKLMPNFPWEVRSRASDQHISPGYIVGFASKMVGVP